MTGGGDGGRPGGALGRRPRVRRIAGGGAAGPQAARPVVVVVHGGRSVSTEPTGVLQPAVLRMIPVATGIRRAVRGSGTVVRRPRLRLRGWNGPDASPVGDLERLLGRLPEDSPVVLIGHSMGARAALRAAGHPRVIAVAGLAPWLPSGEPVQQLAGRQVLLAHGSADTVTSPADTWTFASRAQRIAPVAAIEVRGGEHAMVRRARLWHRLAAEFACSALGLPAGDHQLRRALDQAVDRAERTVL